MHVTESRLKQGHGLCSHHALCDAVELHEAGGAGVGLARRGAVGSADGCRVAGLMVEIPQLGRIGRERLVGRCEEACTPHNTSSRSASIHERLVPSICTCNDASDVR